jgi:probable HAF family extracellular repeat protein
MKQWFCGLMALGLFLGMAGQAKAQPTYTFTTLDVPGTLWTYNNLNGINASGQIVGSYDGGAFLLDQGSYTALDLVPSGINDLGQIVGGNLLFDHGSYTTLDVPGAYYTIANGINNSGQIVGYYADGHGYHGFLFDQGNYTTLQVPGSYFTYPYGISNSGQIVGSYYGPPDCT